MPPMLTPAPPRAEATAQDRRPEVDLLAPSIWSDRLRLLVRPDVVAVELLLLCAVAILLRQPLAALAGTAPEDPPVAPAPAPAPASPLALIPVAPPSAARHEPRDPFAPLVDNAVPADGAPPAPDTQTPTLVVVDSPAPPAAEPVPAAPDPTSLPAPAVDTPSTVTVKPGETLWRLAARHGTTARALYAANRDTIGSDPDLLRPGLVLVLPPAA